MRTTADTFVKFNRALADLDEVQSLAACMGISRAEAMSYVALLVSMGVQRATDDGQIDFLTDKCIEDACVWEGVRGGLIAAFMESGVCMGERYSDTNPLYIAPNLWELLAGDTIKKREAARKRKQKQRENERLNRN